MNTRPIRANYFAIGAIVLACAFIAPPACAQQFTAPPSQPPAQPLSSANQQPPQSNKPAVAKQNQDQTAGAPTQQNGTSNDRLFWTLPDFLTLENVGKVPPLTTGQEFRVVTRETLDWSTIPYVAFVAALSQADRNDKSYGQGWGAYGKRSASAFGDTAIENYMVGAVFPSMLGEDPRYYQMGKGGFWRRTKYSVSRIVITRTNAGNNRFNYSEIVGAAVAAGVGNIYHAQSDRTFSNTMSIWGQQVAWDTFTVEMREFWPDLRRAVGKRRDKNQ